MTAPNRGSRDHHRGRDHRDGAAHRREPARTGPYRIGLHSKFRRPLAAAVDARHGLCIGGVCRGRRKRHADQRLGAGAVVAGRRLGVCLRHRRLGSRTLADDKACAQVYGPVCAGSRLSPDRVQGLSFPRRRAALGCTLRCQTGSRIALLRQARRRLRLVQVAQ
jgi:hypothetical protein